MIWKKRIKFFIANWKIGIHLVFRTYHFGVNNELWVKWKSRMGVPLYERTPMKIYQNIVTLEIRSRACGMLSPEEYELVFFRKHPHFTQ